MNRRIIRIGVFYDGNYFLHVSNYYLYHHHRKARISIGGLHSFIKDITGREEGTDNKYCQIVDAHYFRGRLDAYESDNRNLLFKERLFDDILIREGITTHYLPLTAGGEKGIDVWLALEAFELAMHKQFDISVIIAGDGDYVPLVRKLNTIGTRVMVLAWDFSYVDENYVERTTRTSQILLNEVSYPVLMNNVIDDRSRHNDPMIDNLFVQRKENYHQNSYRPPAGNGHTQPEENVEANGQIVNLNSGFGFISPAGGGDNVFFHHSELKDLDFNELAEGETVSFRYGHNARGVCALRVRPANPDNKDPDDAAENEPVITPPEEADDDKRGEE